MTNSKMIVLYMRPTELVSTMTRIVFISFPASFVRELYKIYIIYFFVIRSRMYIYRFYLLFRSFYVHRIFGDSSSFSPTYLLFCHEQKGPLSPFFSFLLPCDSRSIIISSVVVWVPIVICIYVYFYMRTYAVVCHTRLASPSSSPVLDVM